MCIEIEAKLKVESHAETAKKLAELAAEFQAEQFQTDVYFDDAKRTLTEGDRCLRLRRERVGASVRMFLTYKGAREKDEFKKRGEIEVEVDSADSAEKLLLSLGYEKAVVVEKRRRVWRLGDCRVALDELPLLGSFVEIEGPDGKRIAEVQRSLGLGALSHIPDSYASLTAEKIGHQHSGQQL
ncbi:MAG: class IV adenylate cyclase [Planctomycetota bacterium]|jgi:adenylate cyclase class 2